MNVKKQGFIVVIIILVLLFFITVFAYLNTGDIDYKKNLEMNVIFEIRQGSTTIQVTMDDMIALNPIKFDAVLDTSITDATDVQYWGVELKNIFSHFAIDIPNAKSIEVHSLDGYATALTIEELKKTDFAYIAIAQGEKPLKKKADGGWGPYLFVIKSPFSNRWCKFVQEIVIR